jgi:hypothetical protein
MTKIIKLSETDLTHIVNRIIKEDNLEYWKDFGFEDEDSYLKDFIEADEYALELIFDVDSEIIERLTDFFESIDLRSIIEEKKRMFRKKYPEYSNFSDSYENEHMSYLLNAKTNEDPEILADKLSDKGIGGLMNYVFYSK